MQFLGCIPRLCYIPGTVVVPFAGASSVGAEASAEGTGAGSALEPAGIDVEVGVGGFERAAEGGVTGEVEGPGPGS
jgi:hypothetical protein